MEYDAHNSMFGFCAFNFALISGDGTHNGNIVGTAGFDALEFFIQSATLNAGNFTVALEAGDDVALSDAVVIDSELVLGPLPSFDDTEDQTVKRVGTITKKRYVRLNMVLTNSGSGAIGATAVLSVSDSSPTAEQS